jgi:hypothetical protein
MAEIINIFIFAFNLQRTSVSSNLQSLHGTIRQRQRININEYISTINELT